MIVVIWAVAAAFQFFLCGFDVAKGYTVAAVLSSVAGAFFLFAACSRALEWERGD